MWQHDLVLWQHNRKPLCHNRRWSCHNTALWGQHWAVWWHRGYCFVTIAHCAVTIRHSCWKLRWYIGHFKITLGLLNGIIQRSVDTVGYIGATKEHNYITIWDVIVRYHDYNNIIGHSYVIIGHCNVTTGHCSNRKLWWYKKALLDHNRTHRWHRMSL